MYERHFGLNKRPFLANATGGDVFVGPQTVNTMAGLKKALSAQDAVVAVSGPAGVGKTTLVAKALDALSNSHRTVRIGRMQLDGTDALEFLLEELGTGKLPRGPIRQFAAFRKLLVQLESSGKRLVIIVEDAIRTGIETLAEIEALTAADAGESGGAAIVIMGDESVAGLLADSQLARLSQRTRQRLTINPLSLAELRGYLMHCFRSAGGEFHDTFDDRSADVLHSLSGGVPRVANYVAEAALSAAVTDGISPIPAETVARIARDEFGLEPAFDTPDPAPSTAPGAAPEPPPFAEEIREAQAASEPAINVEPEPIPEPDVEPEPIPEPDLEPENETLPKTEPLSEADQEPEPDPRPVPEAEPEPATVPVLEPVGEAIPEAEPVDADPIIVFADTDDDAPFQDEEDVPELIQDTLPNLEVLAPDVIAQEPTETELPVLNAQPAAETGPEPVPEAEPEKMSEQAHQPVAEVEPEPIPEPLLEIAPAPEPEVQPDPAIEPPLGTLPDVAPELTLDTADEDVPEWDRDPTLAELRPDLDALEKAMAFAHGEAQDEEQTDFADVVGEELELEEIPEITLDSSIEENIENTLIDEPDSVSPGEPDAGEIAAPAAPDAAPEPRKAQRADGEMEKIAAELARAKTIEDVDDKLAETLFGDQISMIAAQVVTSGSAESANDARLFDTQAAQLAQATGSPASVGPGDPPPAPEPVLQDAVEVSIESPEIVDSGLDLSASQRLRTVRALNADLHPSLREPGNGPDPGPDVPARDLPAPEPIEDQIDTSITQTLKALKVTPPVCDDATENDEADEKRKGGFFSRFKRS